MPPTNRSFNIGMKEQLIRVGMNTKDFCGDVRRAILEAANDYGYRLSEDAIGRLIIEVNERYNESRNAARMAAQQ